METKWQLQDAKNRFSELVEKAIALGPQTVTKRGKETVVVLSVEEYKKLTKPKSDLVDFFKNSPLHDIDIDLERDKDLPREIEL
jgi:prevent-host-death family protein